MRAPRTQTESKEARNRRLERQREYNRQTQHLRYDVRRAARLRRQFGLSVEDFDRMMFDQGGRCLFCEKLFDEKKKPCVDHNHETGMVRAILCHGCNRDVGGYEALANHPRLREFLERGER